MSRYNFFKERGPFFATPYRPGCFSSVHGRKESYRCMFVCEGYLGFLVDYFFISIVQEEKTFMPKGTTFRHLLAQFQSMGLEFRLHSCFLKKWHFTLRRQIKAAFVLRTKRHGRIKSSVLESELKSTHTICTFGVGCANTI